MFQIKSLCDVEYRKLNFSAYPVHVRHLTNYAFKPVVVAVSIWYEDIVTHSFMKNILTIFVLVFNVKKYFLKSRNFYHFQI